MMQKPTLTARKSESPKSGTNSGNGSDTIIPIHHREGAEEEDANKKRKRRPYMINKWLHWKNFIMMQILLPNGTGTGTGNQLKKKKLAVFLLLGLVVFLTSVTLAVTALVFPTKDHDYDYNNDYTRHMREGHHHRKHGHYHKHHRHNRNHNRPSLPTSPSFEWHPRTVYMKYDHDHIHHPNTGSAAGHGHHQRYFDDGFEHEHEYENEHGNEHRHGHGHRDHDRRHRKGHDQEYQRDNESHERYHEHQHQHHHGSPQLPIYDLRKQSIEEIEFNHRHQSSKDKHNLYSLQQLSRKEKERREKHAEGNRNRRSNLYSDHPECVPMHDWMNINDGNNNNGNGITNHHDHDHELVNNPLPLSTCNIVHEYPLYNFYNDEYVYEDEDEDVHERGRGRGNGNRKMYVNDDIAQIFQPKLLGNGSFRSAYRLANTFTSTSHEADAEAEYEYVALKTLRDVDDGRHYPDSHFLTNHRVDALFYERLSSSEYIVDIYAHCGNGGLYEFASGKLSRAVRGNDNGALTQGKRLDMAIQIVRGVVDMHTIESRKSHSAFVHSDLKVDQFVQGEDGLFKLNDFNKGHLMYWNSTSDASTCPYAYRKGPHPNKFAAPEEYRDDYRTEKLDVYSMGNVLYFILVGDDPFGELENEEAVALLRRGKRPKIDIELRESTDVVDVALVKAVEMCYVRDWKERHTSMDVLDLLLGAKEKMQMKMNTKTDLNMDEDKNVNLDMNLDVNVDMNVNVNKDRQQQRQQQQNREYVR